ncbi:uncharacterized protein LOC131843988 [Achroia grisella]|uniref:uncharacterized protein LOC131843988 n=1 Tax=Achroia grisella TaxID=688607 RepID=UPI0027D2519E|nr:uncharacterized protein LOC131843988 [Achroia grisella]
MDYSSIDSEIIESLDILRHPAKRLCRNNLVPNRTLTRQQNTRYTFNDTKIIKKTEFSHLRRETSPFSKKAAEREIFNHYSVLNRTSQLYPYNSISPTTFPQSNVAKERPLIKVTVIPKSVQTQTSNVFKRRSNYRKNIHATLSNQESSIRTRNVYLDVAGRNRDKTYDIKNVGSAKFSRNNLIDNTNNNISLEQINCLKQVISSLNMDKKKKKDNNKNNETGSNKLEMSQKIGNTYKNDKLFRCCYCPDFGKSDVVDIGSQRSHVRITGQLGLVDDERCVLRCAATVNDSPVTTKYCTAECVASPIYNANFHQNKIKNQRDFIIQTEMWKSEEYNGVNIERNVLLSKSSHGTQVNFNTDLLNIDRTKLKKSMNLDKITQCNSSNTDVVETKEQFNSNVKKCHSPLVVISVYTNQELPDVKVMTNTLNKNNTKSATIKNNPITKGTSWYVRNKKTEDKKINSNIGRSRSPSPRSRSPLKANKEFGSKLGFMRQKLSPEVGQNMNIVQRQERFKKTATNSIVTKFDTLNKSRNKLENENNSLRSNFAETKGTNTDHNILTKKAIIESYTRQLLKDKERKVATGHDNLKNNESRVAVNIDGDKEYYDVLFQQGNLTTDLRVRKILKAVGIQDYANDSHLDSMENLLLVVNEKEPRKRSLSRTLYGNDNDDIPTLDKITSGLNVRDSLEICHRRDNRSTKCPIFSTMKNNGSQNNNKDRLANKHYRGDDCCIPDPVTRDKEIRKLLGIDKYTQSTSTSVKPQAPKSGIEVPMHCFYRRQCEKNLLTGLSLVGMSPCACCDQNFLDHIESKKLKKTKQEIQNNHIESNVSDETNPTNESNETTNKPVEPDADDEQKVEKKPIRAKFSTTEQNSVYQQMILNRNIQVFLQVEQFTKQKPIILSRKQYNKVKRTIERTISKKITHRKQCICKFSFVSVGDIRKKYKHENERLYDKNIQTEEIANKISTKTDSSKKSNRSRVESLRTREKTTDKGRNMTVETMRTTNSLKTKIDNKNTLVLFTKETKATMISENDSVQLAVSNMEVRYASMAILKQVTLSSNNVAVGSTPALSERVSRSVHTIFKGHRKSPTPNLGTSACSLYSDVEDHYENASLKNNMQHTTKPRKALLRRLMSCLVLRTAAASKTKIYPPVCKAPSLNSTFDSYHINTSFGAIEVSSSIYDTSVSFYTNHSILPINNKVKRSFLSSVRGFIANRKS